MRPGLILVVDPVVHRAAAEVKRMLTRRNRPQLPVVGGVRAAHWAAVGIAPPVHLPDCGGDLYTEDGLVLLWAGDVRLPASWLGWETPESFGPRSISRILLSRLRREGFSVLDDVDGAYCGLWHDMRRQTWQVFNDRWGQLPVYWYQRGGRLIVAPHAWQVWQSCGEALRIDPRGITDLLRTQNMIDDHTLLADVHWLEPANILEWNGAVARPRAYWRFRHRPRPAVHPDEPVENLVEVHQRTVRRLIDDRAPVLLGISGGLDSRLILASCHAVGRVPVCFTSGFRFYDDVRFGRRLARVAGARHHSLILTGQHLDQRLAELVVETDGLHGAGHLVLNTPLRDFWQAHAGSILLEGYLHGVLGGSDLPGEDGLPADRPPHRHGWAEAYLHGGGKSELINQLLLPELAAESWERWCDHVDGRFHGSSAPDDLSRVEETIICGRSGRNDVLATSLARSYVLVRSPACDRPFLDWCISVPSPQRVGRRPYIEALKRYYPPFARVSRADGSNGFPLAGGRWLREYCWQREKLHRRYVRWRYPWTRRWGTHSSAIRGWTLDMLDRRGALDTLRERDARVREWIRPEVLDRALMNYARQPGYVVPLLSLWTAETMIRWLEKADTPDCVQMAPPVCWVDLGCPAREGGAQVRASG